MIRHLFAVFERALVAVLVLSFGLPLAVAGWLRFFPDTSPATAWLRNATLVGMQIPPVDAPLSWANALSAKYQSASAEHFDFNFAGRELLIRLMNEIDLHGLRAAPAGLLVGGSHLSIIETPYAEEYCLWRGRPNALRPLVDNLRRLQDFCRARRIAFALVITPSKAAIYPEDLPGAWLRRYRRGPRYYDDFISLLKEENIRYVDGHEIAAQLKPTGTVPVFPPGGVHWGDRAAVATVNALLELLASQGLPVAPIRNFHFQISRQPTGQDADMVGLMNIMDAPIYPVEVFRLEKSTPPAIQSNMVVVGGSFVLKMLDLLDASRQFSEMNFYRYYKVAEHVIVHAQAPLVLAPAPALNFETDVFAADSLVLEVNEEYIREAPHLIAFLHDALAALPNPQAAKAPFHY